MRRIAIRLIAMRLIAMRLIDMRWIAIGAWVSIQLPLMPVARVQAQERSCSDVIQEVRADIEGRLGGRVERLGESVIAGMPPSPYKQKGELNLRLGSYEDRGRAQRSSDIMNSDSLMKGYADRLIRACQEVVRVSFNLIGTDWLVQYSWIENRETRRDLCHEPDRHGGREIVWGQQFCL